MSCSATRCHIKLTIKGILDQSWSDYFGSLAIEPHTPSGGEATTVITGVLPDQSAFVGILNSMQGFNLTLLAVNYRCEAA